MFKSVATNLFLHYRYPPKSYAIHELDRFKQKTFRSSQYNDLNQKIGLFMCRRHYKKNPNNYKLGSLLG